VINNVMTEFSNVLFQQMRDSEQLDDLIRENLKVLGYQEGRDQ